MSTLALAFLRLLPQHLVSHLAGRAASLRLPRPLRRPVLGAFGRTFGVDFGEVVGALDDYASVQEFFTRPMPAGARPIDASPDSVVAPCDGRWGAAGIVEKGMLLQVKGRPYSVAALLGSEADATHFEGGPFATLYLAPRNYHRFHSPCDAAIRRVRYVPGKLWPVNRIGVEGVDGLFAQNERICAFMEVAARPLCLVAVGATMVGKVRLRFDDLSTNAGSHVVEERHYPAAGQKVAKGEEWGRFEFGSTIVLLAHRDLLQLDMQEPGTELRLGRRIGTLRS